MMITNKKYLSNFVCAIALIIVLIGYSATHSTILIPTDVKPASTSTMIVPTFIPTTPIILPSQEQLLIEALYSTECLFPCYLGITPGVTNWSEAKNVLESLGGTPAGNSVRNNGDVEHSYALKIQEGINNASVSEYTDEYILMRVNLLIKDNTIQIMRVVLIVTAPTAKFYEYWSNYSIENIFQNNGLPNEIYIAVQNPYYVDETPYFLIDYGSVGATIEFWGVGQGDYICPRYGDKVGQVILYLYNKADSSVDIYADGHTPPDNRSIWLPVEEVLGIDNSLFYYQTLTNPLICFLAQ